MTLRRRFGAAMSIGAVGALALAGCAAATPKVASLDQPAAAAPTAAADDSADAAKLQQCFSDNGIDMKVSDRGVEVDPSVTQEAFMKAAQACQKFMGAATRNRGFNDMSPELKEKLLAVAKCVRAAGYPDWPDPGGDKVMASNPHEWPGFDEAHAKCQQEAGLVGG